ncbi:MAG: tRNA (adenosine(37)-N6)-threonylcarbamoyltransferase complex transferase subunit TsaD [Gemmatimonadetes bacterium]|nr:tRNA (adenosine(37)-N6)-threonylcarbamoyltransferase complex transferase subunit TsaD [Gemmatimonadota bacterium]
MSLILGIESSCDDTATAVVENGVRILATWTSTQAVHEKYGGIVPELASRDHLRQVLPAVRVVLERADVSLDEIDAIAVTHGPGLVGSLLVGVSFAQGISLARGIRTIAVNHLHAHLLVHRVHAPDLEWPVLGLLVSGGHTELVRMDGPNSMRVLGATRDDAAGEAFDKVGKLVDLAFPAGPIIDRLARGGDPDAVSFPRAMLKPSGNLDFSFSGLKTAVAQHVRSRMSAGGRPLAEDERNDLLASFQEAVVDVLVKKTVLAADRQGLSRVVLAGGVAANTRLRTELEAELRTIGARLITSPPELCTDNGTMVAVAAEQMIRAGTAEPVRNAEPNLPVCRP